MITDTVCEGEGAIFSTVRNTYWRKQFLKVILKMVQRGREPERIQIKSRTLRTASRRAAGGWEEKVQEPSRNSIIPADPHCGSQGLPLPATQALCPKLAQVHQQSSHLLLRDLFLSRCEKTPPFWLSFLGFFFHFLFISASDGSGLSHAPPYSRYITEEV